MAGEDENPPDPDAQAQAAKEDAKCQRTARKSALTRQGNKVRQVIAEKDAEKVNAEVAILNRSL